MPSLKILELNKIMGCDGWQNKFKSFYESGTFRGDTTFIMRHYFENVYSVEVDINNYVFCIGLVVESDMKNVHLYHGDSAKLLPEILKIKGIEGPTTFFLDGHYSGKGTGKGEKDCPLLEELAVITKRNQPDLIIIDDFRLFGTKANEDWSEISIESVHKALGEKRIFHSFTQEDRLCIFLKG